MESDVWTIYFNRSGFPVGVSGPALPVAEWGREEGIATMRVVPLAPLERECDGPYEAQQAIRDVFPGGLEAFRDCLPGDDKKERAKLMRRLMTAISKHGRDWRRDFSQRRARSPHDAEDTWGVK